MKINELKESFSTDISSCLKKIFGFDSFKSNQEDIIHAILKGSDIFAVMPTGGGKSLCYQLPAYLSNGTCVVISPLIALMKDQVDAAKNIGLKADFLNSSLTSFEMSQVYRSLENGELDLLYVAPERFAMSSFTATLKNVPLCLFAVDEAHCISEWGHDFRPDYMHLSEIIKNFPHVPVSAFTATATGNVQDDIVNKLGLRDPYQLRASFDRPNLFYQVTGKSNVEQQIFSFIHEHRNESGIIYRTTRQSVENTAESLAENGIKALPYHAGLDNETRKNNQEAFNRDEVNVIVATIAFGMGIDKSNVRFVIHGDLPKNMESYYQETGRAGRDGEPAHCMFLFSRGDIPKIRFFIEQISDEKEKYNASVKLNEMVNYASINVCRRRQVLSYFGEDYSNENCGTCDICADKVERVDATIDAKIVMSAMARTNQRFGIGHIIDVLKGANTQKIRNLKHNEIKTYGAGKDKDKYYWRGVIDELLGQKHVIQTEDQYPVLKLSKEGIELLKGEGAFFIIKREEAQEQLKAHPGDDFNMELFERLRIVRRGLAEEQDVPPFVIFSDKSLHEMCRYFPVTNDEFIMINGVGERKREQYGDDFIEVIQSFISSNPDVVPMSPIVRVMKKGNSKVKKSNTLAETWKMVEEGLSYNEIAEKRGLTSSTIAGHIERFILEGKNIDINCHIETEKRKEIEDMFTKLNTSSLRRIVDASGKSVSFEEARLVRAVLESRE